MAKSADAPRPQLPVAPAARKPRTKVEYKSPQHRAQVIATKRVNNTLKALGTLRALSNRKQYDLTDAQRKAILDAIADRFEQVRKLFETSSPAGQGGFALPDPEAPAE